MLNVFLGYVTSSSKAAALRRLKDAHAAVLGVKLRAWGDVFFLEGLQPSQKGFPKSQGIGGVGSWVVESLARSGIGGSELQRFWVG